MKVRKAIKRIVALSTGAAMLGATMFGAMAADLANYPSPLFIKDGVFDGVLVVGDNAAAEDIIGVTNIATSLQAASVKKKVVETSGTVVDVEGDAKKIGTSSNFLEFGEALNAAGITTVDAADLAALKDGSIQNNRGTFKYTQSIDLPNAVVTYAKDSDLSDDAALYLKFNSGVAAYTYKVTFTPSLESEVDTSANLKDIRDKSLTILGKEYTVLTAKNDSGSGVTLTLFSGALTDILAEGSSKTYTLKTKEYQVTASYISTSEVMFTVNGQTTDKLQEGETYRLNDGTEIGVRDILAQQYAGEATGGDKVQFSLGAQKVKIVDTSITDNTYETGVTVGNEDLGNVQAAIVGTKASGVVKISELDFKYAPSSAVYVPVNGKLSKYADMKESEEGNVLFGGFDIEFKGVSTGTTETLKVEPDGTYNYKLSFTNRNGDKYSVPVWTYKTSDGVVTLGDSDGTTRKDLVVNESQWIDDEDMFILSPSATQKTHIMQFKSINTNDKTFKIKDMMSGGATVEVTYNGTFTVDGTSYKANISGTQLLVDLDGDGTYPESNQVLDIYTRYSGSDGKIVLTYGGVAGAASNVTKFFAEKAENMPSADYQDGMNWTLTYDATNAKIKLSEPSSSMGVLSSLQKVEDKDVKNTWTHYGAYATYDYTNSEQPKLEIVYPDNQAEALVYVTSGAVTTSESTTGGMTTDVVQTINVGAVKLASEVTTPSAHNLILVGGPCANSVARQVMGVTAANCADGFEAGKAMIKLYEHAPGKVAMVVAGYNSVDTRRASQVVANYKDYAASLKGMEVEVTTVTSTPTVAAPKAKTTTTETGNQ